MQLVKSACEVIAVTVDGSLYIDFRKGAVTIRLSLKQWTVLERKHSIVETNYYFGEPNASYKLDLTNGVFLCVWWKRTLCLCKYDKCIFLDSDIFDYVFFKRVNMELENLDTDRYFHS